MCAIHITAQEWATDYWHQGGLPADKLVVGLAVYGRALELTDKDNNRMGAPAKGAASAGKWTREKGFWAYYEVIMVVLHMSSGQNNTPCYLDLRLGTICSSYIW